MEGTRGRRLVASVGAAALATLVALLAASCTEEPPAPEGTAPAVSGVDTVGDDPEANSVVEQFAGEEASFGTVPDAPTVADGEPIKVGLINQENVPIGSYPEIRFNALAAAELINQELGGVDGHPIEIVPCITEFSVESSQGCAQELVQEGVVAVVGGLDITSNGSLPVLEQNGIPYVGGIPVNFVEMESPISFQFSGGSPGAMVGFVDHAVEQGAESVAVVYSDYPPIKAAAVDYGISLLRALGVEEITEVPYPITATDLLPVITQAAEGDPDAILMFAADAACTRTMQTVADLEIEADVYLVGSCAAPAILDEAGDAAEGTIFSVEGPFVGMDTDVVDGALYLAAAERYAEEYDGPSAGTVSFRAVMNLYSILSEIAERDGADAITPDAIVDTFRSAEAHPSFDGHDFTCDGEQVPELPALCAPQQVLIRMVDGELALESDGWIDVPTVLHEHLP